MTKARNYILGPFTVAAQPRCADLNSSPPGLEKRRCGGTRQTRSACLQGTPPSGAPLSQQGTSGSHVAVDGSCTPASGYMLVRRKYANAMKAMLRRIKLDGSGVENTMSSTAQLALAVPPVTKPEITTESKSLKPVLSLIHI